MIRCETVTLSPNQIVIIVYTIRQAIRLIDWWGMLFRYESSEVLHMVMISDISVNWNGIGTEIILNQLTGTRTGTWIIPGTRTELERNLFKIVGTGTNSNYNYFQAYLCFSTLHDKFYFFVLQAKILIWFFRLWNPAILFIEHRKRSWFSVSCSFRGKKSLTNGSLFRIVWKLNIVVN